MIDNRARNRLTAAIAAGISSFLTPFMSSSINIALPALSQELHLDAITLGWVANISLLSAGIFLVPFGRLADIAGRKRIFALGLSLYSAASLLGMIARNPELLLIARFLQGMGGAMVFGTGVAILTSVYPPAEKGLALGINTALVYTGLSVGPFLGGIVTQHFTWRAIFALNLPLSLGALLIVLFGLKGEWAEAHGEKFDLIGSLIYGTGLMLLMFGFTLLPKGYAVLLIGTGVLAVFGFVILELKITNPVFPFQLFQGNLIFTFSNLAALINYAATAAVGFLLSLYLQYIKGLTPQSTGLLLVSQPVVMALFSPLAGRFSDRIQPRLIASIGMAISTLGLFLFSFLTATTNLRLLIAGLVLVGLGFALFSAPNTNAVMAAVAARHYGIASATLGTMRLLGQMFSLGLAQMLIALFVGPVRLSTTNHTGLISTVRVAFIIFSVLCGAGIFASLARGKVNAGAGTAAA
ncbi:MAG: MFS transporter [candidate division WOR-3 bacterium]|nr:MFS transporter [candidate division WOR-3 bacterium]MDH7519319.1 MFS transporter [bacterium]